MESQHLSMEISSTGMEPRTPCMKFQCPNMEHVQTRLEAGTPDMEPGISVIKFDSPCIKTGLPDM